MSHTAERYHDISCGHRVHNHESKCRHLHGHNYRIHFVCKAESLDDIGRVIDFGDIKARLCMWVEDNWDHKFLAWEDDPVMNAIEDAIQHHHKEGLIDEDEANPVYQSLVWVPFNPTAENMAQHLVEVVGPRQLKGTGIVLTHCRIEETRKCTASYSLPVGQLITSEPQVVNIIDPTKIRQYLETEEGERVVMESVAKASQQTKPGSARRAWTAFTNLFKCRGGLTK